MGVEARETGTGGGDVPPRKMRAMGPRAAADLRALWEVPPGVDEALFAAAQAADPVVAESHMAEARALLDDDDA